MFTGDHLETAIKVARDCNIISNPDMDSAGNQFSKIAVTAESLRQYFEPLVYEDEDGAI
jgi:magnesium-transporting ATPase (P-type)